MDSGGKQDFTSPDFCRRGIAWSQSFCLLTGTLLCVWLAVQTGRYALAQRYCPTEIDTVGNRSEFGVSAANLQGALQLNPLNGDYWLDLAISIEWVDANGTSEGIWANADGSAINLEAIPGWEQARGSQESLQAWALSQALGRSPAAGEFWLVLADHLWERLQSGQGEWRGKLIDRVTQCYNMAIELQPNSSAVRERAAEFSEWLKQEGPAGQLIRQVLYRLLRVWLRLRLAQPTPHYFSHLLEGAHRGAATDAFDGDSVVLGVNFSVAIQVVFLIPNG